MTTNFFFEIKKKFAPTPGKHPRSASDRIYEGFDTNPNGKSSSYIVIYGGVRGNSGVFEWRGDVQLMMSRARNVS